MGAPRPESASLRRAAGRAGLAACLVAALVVPSRRLDLVLSDLCSLSRSAPDPSAAVTLIVADPLTDGDAAMLAQAGAATVEPGEAALPERGAFEGTAHRRLPAKAAAPFGRFWGATHIDWRGSIQSCAFLTYEVADLRAGRVPSEALRGRMVLHGPRGTGLSELVATPIGPVTALEYAANVRDCTAAPGTAGERPRPFLAFPLWLQFALALAPLVLAVAWPGKPAYAAVAAVSGLGALMAIPTAHVLPGFFACTAGWLAAWSLGGTPREARLEALLEAGRFEELLAAAAPGDDYLRARALAGLKRYDQVESLLARADLRGFPARGGAELAGLLSKAGFDGPALVLLEWAIVSAGPSPELSQRAADLRSRQEGLKGLLGMEGIQRLISGRYTDVAFLGQGGMGIVLSAHDTYLDRPVALKVLNPTLLNDASARARFRREVETMMRLNHPAIIEIHSVHSDDLLYFAMEFLKGGSVHDALKRDSQRVDRVEVLRTVAEAMAHCHEQGILHRDLKTDNVFLLEDGRVKLIDFGIARAVGGTDLTAQGELVGTLGYLAPEMFRGAGPSPLTDIFAFGVMTFEMYAGKLPFAHPLSMGAIVPPPGMPPGVQQTMMQTLAADPTARPQTFREVERMLGEGPSTASPL